MTFSKAKERLARFVVLGFCIGLAFIWAGAIRSGGHRHLIAGDFAEMYYSARCALHGADPYDPEVVLHEFQMDGGKFGAANPTGEALAKTVVSRLSYPPTILLVVAPLAELPWQAALTLWMWLIAGSMVLAAYLVWDITAEVRVLAGGMACYMLLSSIVLGLFGNPAGLSVAFAVISVWCLVEERYAPAGVVLLALSLVIKPQIAGFLWLYFLLAGGTGRKRAMQALAVVGVASICAVAWVSLSSPHWIEGEQRNFTVYSARGGGADPGPSGNTYKSFDQIVNLQSAVSVLRNDPRFYNPVAYVIAGGLILAWVIAVLRKRSTPKGALQALATISVLTLLPVYHATHDAKLLLLTIPACAMLWSGGGAKRWVALGLTAGAILVTSDIPMLFWPGLVEKLPLRGKPALWAVHPAPLVLLAAGCFYLWIYIRYNPAADGVEFKPNRSVVAAAAAVN